MAPCMILQWKARHMMELAQILVRTAWEFSVMLREHSHALPISHMFNDLNVVSFCSWNLQAMVSAFQFISLFSDLLTQTLILFMR